MVDIKGFKHVTYREFQSELHKKSADAEIPDVNLATAINVKSVATVRNVFNTQNQVVSDEVLTKAMKALGLNGLVVWFDGARNYYLSNKN